MRPKNSIPSIKIRLQLNELLVAQIDLALHTGLFGANRQACAERIIAEGLRRLVKEGVIQTEQDKT